VLWTDDKDKDASSVSTISISEDEKLSGVIKCVFFSVSTVPTAVLVRADEMIE
jgi:hypothetical protein